MAETIFDKIASGKITCFKVWEDTKFLAFLTPYPNTPGVTVVIPKKNIGSYIFSLTDNDYIGLLKASKKVAKILEKAFDTPRVAMIFEGTGVAYVHTKLYPLHGKLASETNLMPRSPEFYSEYCGYLTTIDGPKMDDKHIREIQSKILGAQK